MDVKLPKKEDCTGCLACIDICPKGAISLEMGEYGFNFPKINNKSCIECGLCMKVCPLKSSNIKSNSFKKAYAGYNLNKKELINSTSGGIFTVIAKYILKNRGVVFGAYLSNDKTIKHIGINKSENLKFLQGSKYVQSDTVNIYKKLEKELINNKKVLYSGLPCQIEALYSYLKLRNINYNKLFTCEVLCHGIQSPGIFKTYVNYLEKKNKSKIIKYNFRSKHNTWNKASVELKFENGKSKVRRHRYDVWHTWFGAHYTIRESCFNCKYRKKDRYADLTIGDFWKIENFLPKLNVEKGISLIYVNTLKGKELILRNKKNIFLKEVNLEKTFLGRETVLKNYSIPEKRNQFLEDYTLLPIEKLIKKYPASNLIKTIFNKIKSMVK